jgi:hypothetical protein
MEVLVASQLKAVKGEGGSLGMEFWRLPEKKMWETTQKTHSNEGIESKDEELDSGIKKEIGEFTF